jgi:hypothetical protein
MTAFDQRQTEMLQRLSTQIPVFWNRLTEKFTKTSVTSIQGYLWKKSGGLARIWHKRFFMVSNGVLSWAKTVDEALRSEKSLPLVFCQVRPEPTAPRNNCFSISRSGDTPMILQALTAWDMDQWLGVIQNAKFSHLTSGENIPTAVTYDTVCADCGAPNSSWTSLNWGVTLCDACAGVHRGLGANVSKVRSLALDYVEPLHRALIEAIGSVRANEILTVRCPAEEAIPEDAAAEERGHFIERKYRERAFVAEWDDSDVTAAIQRQELMTVFKFVAAGKLVGDDKGKFGPVHAAACVGNPLILHLLCLNTNDIGALDDAEWSPLCYAAYHGQAVMVDVLLYYGADLQKKGVSPYEIARARGHDALMRRLTALMQPTGLGDDEGCCQLPHQEIVPAPFQLGRFVADPAVYEAPRKTEPDPALVHQSEDLNTVVSQLSHRLTVRGRIPPPVAVDTSMDSFA